MPTHSEDTVHILNSLIETTLDSAHGYEESAEATDNPHLKTLFEMRAMRRKQLTAELQNEVRHFGGEPEDHGTILAKAHRVFVGLRGKVTGGDAKAVVDEVDRGEDVLKAKFEKARDNEDLPEYLRERIGKATNGILADHVEISRLKDQLH